MNLSILGLTVLINDFRGLGVSFAHLACTEVAIDESVIEWGH